MLLAPRIVAATGCGGGDEMKTPAALGSLAQALVLARAAQVKKVPFATKVLDHDFLGSGSTSSDATVAGAGTAGAGCRSVIGAVSSEAFQQDLRSWDIGLE